MTSTLRLIETFAIALWMGSTAVSMWTTPRGARIVRGIAAMSSAALLGVAGGRVALWGVQPVFIGMALIVLAAGAASLIRNRASLAAVPVLAVYAAWMAIRGW
jgi:hypothetical protein